MMTTYRTNTQKLVTCTFDNLLRLNPEAKLDIENFLEGSNTYEGGQNVINKIDVGVEYKNMFTEYWESISQGLLWAGLYWRTEMYLFRKSLMLKVAMNSQDNECFDGILLLWKKIIHHSLPFTLLLLSDRRVMFGNLFAGNTVASLRKLLSKIISFRFKKCEMPTKQFQLLAKHFKRTQRRFEQSSDTRAFNDRSRWVISFSENSAMISSGISSTPCS